MGRWVSSCRRAPLPIGRWSLQLRQPLDREVESPAEEQQGQPSFWLAGVGHQRQEQEVRLQAPVRPADEASGAQENRTEVEEPGFEPDGKDEGEELNFGGEEGRVAKGMRSPVKPTRAEVEEHELTHIPFRDWCIHCQNGRAQQTASHAAF